MAWSAAVLLSLTGCEPHEVRPPAVVACLARDGEGVWFRVNTYSHVSV